MSGVIVLPALARARRGETGIRPLTAHQDLRRQKQLAGRPPAPAQDRYRALRACQVPILDPGQFDSFGKRPGVEDAASTGRDDFGLSFCPTRTATGQERCRRVRCYAYRRAQPTGAPGTRFSKGLSDLLGLSGSKSPTAPEGCRKNPTALSVGEKSPNRFTKLWKCNISQNIYKTSEPGW